MKEIVFFQYAIELIYLPLCIDSPREVKKEPTRENYQGNCKKGLKSKFSEQTIFFIQEIPCAKFTKASITPLRGFSTTVHTTPPFPRMKPLISKII